jgi:hypothetical protein
MADTIEIIELAPSVPTLIEVGPADRPSPVFIPGSASAANAKIQWFSGDGPPPSFIPGARPGAMWVDESGGGLYQL